MPKYPSRLSEVFQALADPTRRAVIERLAGGPASTSELAQPFRMALPSFLQHVQVLEKCRLVESRKLGRVRMYRLVPQPLKEAEKWMTDRRLLWERRLDQLDKYLMEMKRSKKL